MNYYRTLIAVADDCPVSSSAVPATRGGKKTVAVLQYEMITQQPFALTQEDILFKSWFERQAGLDGLTESEVDSLRLEFLSKEQPCLRTSPLPKKHGFGILFDREGRASLCPVESKEYQDIIQSPGDVKVIKALRSSRR